jgi:hypothetical protein
VRTLNIGREKNGVIKRGLVMGQKHLKGGVVCIVLLLSKNKNDKRNIRQLMKLCFSLKS